MITANYENSGHRSCHCLWTACRVACSSSRSSGRLTTPKRTVKIGVLDIVNWIGVLAWQEHRRRIADCSTRSSKHPPPVSPGPIPIPCSRYAAGSKKGARRYQGPGSTRSSDVIGPQSSAEVARIKPYADANNILVISQGSTASSLAIPGDNILRFCPNDTREAEALVALLQHDGIRAIVPLWRNDAGNNGLHDSVQIRFQVRRQSNFRVSL